MEAPVTGRWGTSVEWTLFEPDSNTTTIRCVVKSVNSTMVTVNITVTSSRNIGPDLKPVPDYEEFTVSKNLTAELIEAYNISPGNFTWIGKETLYTKWGPRSCDRYQAMFTTEGGIAEFDSGHGMDGQ